MKKISLAQDYDEMDIVSKGSFKISNSSRLKKTRIRIKDWGTLRVRKNISQTTYKRNNFEYEISVETAF